jgi:hypothetical protein
MATLRQYFETDLTHVVRVKVGLPVPDEAEIEAHWLVDFQGNLSFLICYVPGEGRAVDYFLRLLKAISYGGTQLTFKDKIWLPSARQFPGGFSIANNNPLQISAQFFGDPESISMTDVQMSKRIFIYSETQLSEEDVVGLKREGRALGHEVQFRSRAYEAMRSRQEQPLAFISYDSQDRDIAKKIAAGLQRRMCPVWYDEFSLKIGDNLRESIERGLKDCKKCVLILSANFFFNKGWTKREFDSVFTREILEETRLVLPVWCGVEKQQVYDYSPSLLNVKGLVWNESGQDELCRLLYLAIEPQDHTPAS